MQRLLITLAFFIAMLEVNSQPAVQSFRKLETDQEARIVSPKTDQNGKKCAIIKVVTSQTGFAFDFGMIGSAVATEQKLGEIWVWVPAGARKVTINHQQLGVLRDHLFSIDIESATVYEMVLITGKVETIVKEEIGSEWVVITSDPTGADVYIDDKNTGMQTPFSRQYPLGAHTYRINMDLYHPDAGKFELTPDGGKKKITSILKPAFGQLQITSTPESDAIITIDGKELPQTTPYNLDKIGSGTHKLSLSKKLYHETTKTITITDSETTIENIDLKPAYGTISVTSTPENGATITLDDVSTGQQTPCTLNKVTSGVHTISLRQEWYQPVKKQITVSDGVNTKIDVAMNAVFGDVQITTDPDADIYIDDSKVATGQYSNRLNEGIYTIEARKAKHTPDIKKVQITIGDKKQLTLSPRPQVGTLEIQSIPIDAKITLDGEDRGTTPATLRNLLIGDYLLTLSLPKYGTITKTVTITEKQATQVNEKLLERGAIINSIPAGAQINIDGSDYGTTPDTITNLPAGVYKLTLSMANYNPVITNFTITDGRTTQVNEKLSVSKNISFTSYPSGANLKIDGKFAGLTPYIARGLRNGTYAVELQLNDRMLTQTITVSDEGQRAFDFNLPEAKKIKAPKPYKPTIGFLGMGMSFPVIKDPEYMSVEAMLGGVKTVGLYAKLIVNNYEEKVDYTLKTLPNTYYYNSTTSGSDETFVPYSRLGITGGLLLQAKPIIFYAGAGWGFYNHFIRADLYDYFDDQYVKSIILADDSSVEGIETNAGLLLKLGKLGLSAGVSSIEFKHNEYSVGIGFFF